MNTNKSKIYFTKQLLNWHANENTRCLPWKNEKDPYRIWLSEVILQQTRALQGLPYYLKFTEAYPTVNHLAAANDDEVYRLWQGLGYYNRCKNMLATARLVAGSHNGKFPGTYDELLSLKGIGPYTAAAIASFAFGAPQAVVDGNVYRVLARFFGIDTPFDTTTGKNQFTQLAGELLDKKNSSAYNQAIMDLGATVCSPKKATCLACPLHLHCFAKNHNAIELLPVKSKKTAVKNRYFYYIIFKWQDEIWVHKRGGNDIWENLHEPYLIETSQPIDFKEITNHTLLKKENIRPSQLKHQGNTRQRLTHQLIEAQFFSVEVKQRPYIPHPQGAWIPIRDLDKTAFPKTVLSFFKNNLYF